MPAVVKKRRVSSSTDTKTAIMDTAQELIQRGGANAMSYQHISDAVGIRKASIHHHFPTKDDLIDAVIDRYAAYILEVMDGIFSSKVSPAAKLRKYAALFEATLSEGDCDKACLFGMLGAELSSLGSPAAARVRRFYRDNEERLARVLEDGRDKGDYHFEGDAKRVAAMFFALLEGGALIARAEGGHKRLHALAEQALKLLEE
jgi:TetR/AcrR family transcriptional repressor of nem operon